MCVNIVKMYVGMCVTLHGTYMNTIEDVLDKLYKLFKICNFHH